MISDHVKDVCRIGQRELCCKYLVAGPKGFECMKSDLESKLMVDVNWALNSHSAQGDNCEGVTDFKILNNSHANN